MPYRQFELESAGDSTLLVCWLEDDPRLTTGRALTLVDFPRITWVIRHRYATAREDHPRRTWKVGGLQ